MKHQHLSRDQVLANYQVAKIVEQEVKRQSEAFTMTDRMKLGILEAHRADMAIMLNVLIDQYGISPENARDLMDLWSECLHQYNEGKMQIKQMIGHIELYTGVDFERYTRENMDYAEITKFDPDSADYDGDHSAGGDGSGDKP